MLRRVWNEIKSWYMRELVRDKGRLEDIVEYSSNVLKIIDGIEFEEFFCLFCNDEKCRDSRRGCLYADQGIQGKSPGDSLETGGRYAPCFGAWLFAGVASYSLGNSKREYSRNQGSSGEIPERDRLGTLLWGMMNLFFYTDLY